jgi:hypothetical protein
MKMRVRIVQKWGTNYEAKRIYKRAKSTFILFRNSFPFSPQNRNKFPQIILHSFVFHSGKSMAR